MHSIELSVIVYSFIVHANCMILSVSVSTMLAPVVTYQLTVHAEVFSEAKSKYSTWRKPKRPGRKALGQLVACLLQLVNCVLKLLEALRDGRFSKGLQQISRCSGCEAWSIAVLGILLCRL